MADYTHHAFYRGVLLPRIAYSLGVPQGDHKRVCAELNKAFKDYLCVKSTSDFSNGEFMVFLSAILMLMARERGRLVPWYNEPDHIEEMSMTEWLELQKIIDK